MSFVDPSFKFTAILTDKDIKGHAVVQRLLFSKVTAIIPFFSFTLQTSDSFVSNNATPVNIQFVRAFLKPFILRFETAQVCSYHVLWQIGQHISVQNFHRRVFDLVFLLQKKTSLLNTFLSLLTVDNCCCCITENMINFGDQTGRLHFANCTTQRH